VISDRYIDSSLAYQGAGRTLPVDEVSWLSAWATGGLSPDLVVLLDIDPAVGLDRVSGRGGADRLEAESGPFHERVRYAFLDLATKDPRRYLVIDASGTEKDIAAAIAARVRSLLPAEVSAVPAADLPGHGSAPMTEHVPAPPHASALDEHEPLWTGNGRGGNGHVAGGTGTPPLADEPADNADLHR